MVLLRNDHGTAGVGGEWIVNSLKQESRRRGHRVRGLGTIAGITPSDSIVDDHWFGTVERLRTLVQSMDLGVMVVLVRRSRIRSSRQDLVHFNLDQSPPSPWTLHALDGEVVMLVEPGDHTPHAKAPAIVLAGRVPCDPLQPSGQELVASRFGISRFADRFESISGTPVDGMPVHD